MTAPTVVITGGTHGMGRAAALALARDHATIVIVARDAARGAIVEVELQRAGAAEVTFVRADLSLMSDVRRAAEEIVARHARLDVLINNAAGMFPVRAITSEGHEKTFALDYLAPMLLMEQLAPALEASRAGRIVNVVSKAAERGRLELDDLTLARHYTGLAAYARAKLALIAGTVDLAERHPALHVNCVHPGMVNTGMPQELPFYFRLFVKAFGRFLATADEGAARILRLAVGEVGGVVTGAYFDKERQTELPPLARDSSSRASLHETTGRLLAAVSAH